jgi:hypothetical protein
VRDNLFVWLKNKNRVNVIGYLNIQTRQWNILDFSSRMPICSIIGSEEENLIVYANLTNSEKHYFYKIPFG